VGAFAVLAQVFLLVAGFRWAQDLDPDKPQSLLSGTVFFTVVLTGLGVLAGGFGLHWLALGLSYFIALLTAFWAVTRIDGILWFLVLILPLYLLVLLGGPIAIISMLLR